MLTLTSQYSKYWQIAPYLTYKMGSETMQWSITFYFDAKGRFWLGTYSAHAFICVRTYARYYDLPW